MGHDAPVTVSVAFLAGDGTVGDQVCQNTSCILAALPAPSVYVAKLIALGCVDAVEPDALAGHFVGVARAGPVMSATAMVGTRSRTAARRSMGAV